MLGFKTNANTVTASDQNEMAVRTPVSTIGVTTTSPVTSVRIITERTRITVLMLLKDGNTAKSIIHDHATVKDVDIVFDEHDSQHITINTY